MSETEIALRKPRRRVAAGPARPRYLQGADLDRVMMMLMALMSEVSAIRDRIDTHEALADQGIAARFDAVEAFALTESRAAQRGERRDAMMKRIFRVLLEEVEQDEAARPGSGKPSAKE